MSVVSCNEVKVVDTECELDTGAQDLVTHVANVEPDQVTDEASDEEERLQTSHDHPDHQVCSTLGLSKILVDKLKVMSHELRIMSLL